MDVINNQTDDTTSFIKDQSHTNTDVSPLKKHEDFKKYGNMARNKITKRVLYQIFAFALTFLNYAFLHAIRAAWSNATPQIKKLYDYDDKLISYMNSTFLLFYSSVGIFSGHLADQYNKRWFILITFSLIGANAILLGSQQYFSEQQTWLYFVLRMIDGTIQSVGWATNLAILSNWFPKRGRGLLIGCWASNANVGDIIGAQIYKATSDNLQWGTGIIIVGSTVILLGIINALFLIEYPFTKGIVIEEESHLFQVKQEEQKIEQNEVKSISFIQALLIPGVLIFSICFFFIKFSMYGFYYWLPQYLNDGLGYTKAQQADIFSLFSTGSILGNVLMGFSTDLLPYRSPVFIMGTTLGTIMTLILTLWNSTGEVSISIIMFFLGASLSGSTIVIAAIETDLGKQEVLKNNQKALATVSGIIDGIAGFGSILGQILIGIVKEKAGWRSTFAMLTVSTALSGVPAIHFMIQEYKKWKQSKKLTDQSNI